MGVDYAGRNQIVCHAPDEKSEKLGTYWYGYRYRISLT
jgi:hypothetical protein